MKNKVLNFIIAVLLSLSSLVNTSGVIVQANKNIEPKIFISVKSFKDFLDEIDSGKYKIVKSFDEGITSCEFTIK